MVLIKVRPQILSSTIFLIVTLFNDYLLAKETVHSRKKRILWVTEDDRLALPPNTTLTITPELVMPFVRYPPEGFSCNMKFSTPFEIKFDELGLTDEENPYGAFPSLLSPAFGRTMGTTLADYIGSMLSQRRGKRNGRGQTLLPHDRDLFHGGERAVLYVVIQEFLDNFGMNGRACLLRAICEVHSTDLTNYGLFGEIVKLFLTASRSPLAELMTEYVRAEEFGKKTFGTENHCWSFTKECPKSMFRRKNDVRYRSSHEKTVDDDSHNNV